MGKSDPCSDKHYDQNRRFKTVLASHFGIRSGCEVVYVDSKCGEDKCGNGTTDESYRTLDYALSKINAQATTYIQLAPGDYTVSTDVAGLTLFINGETEKVGTTNIQSLPGFADLYKNTNDQCGSYEQLGINLENCGSECNMDIQFGLFSNGNFYSTQRNLSTTKTYELHKHLTSVTWETSQTLATVTHSLCKVNFNSEFNQCKFTEYSCTTKINSTKMLKCKHWLVKSKYYQLPALVTLPAGQVRNNNSEPTTVTRTRVDFDDCALWTNFISTRCTHTWTGVIAMNIFQRNSTCLLYTSPSPRDRS